MSSILTNRTAMVALSTLRDINKGLGQVSDQVSTGKKVANAKDNAATWAISAVMKSDVTGFKAITETLSLGSSTLNVARAGAETVNNLMDELKGRIIAAQADNVDRGKINDDATELRNNINATVTASQFNGLNLLQGDAGNDTVEVTGSLDRDSSGNVTVANIDVQRASLEEGDVGTQLSITAAQADVAAANVNGLTIGAGTTYSAGDKISLAVIGTESGEGIILSYTVTEADAGLVAGTAAATVTQMSERVFVAWTNQARDAADAVNGTTTGATDLVATVGADVTTATGATGLGQAIGQLIGKNSAATNAGTNVTVTVGTGVVQFASTLAGRTTLGTGLTVQAAQGGGLSELGLVDLSTKGGAKAALGAIEGMTQTSIEAAAAFGSSGKRVDIQMDFLKNLTDSLTTGIGAIVDTDMEEASAKLQALQVQQQLGIQSLSIANQQPQTLLSLFR